ncbi:MAG TPA: TerC/Alx family metal homeostasis membrane protein [Kofleriaceae bacterium]|nr:TerC/Alx family metal homeostasis membrane protein [Kofleriaceae bacterium]
MRSALLRSAGWFALAVLFGMLVTGTMGTQRGLEFFTAYLLEQALSVDNLFVMMLVFARFRVPRASQRRVLTWGIAGVVVLRGFMILTGTALVGAFHVLTYALGALLLYSAVRLAGELGEDDDDDGGAATQPIMTRVRGVLSRVMPITDDFVGARFTVVRRGVRHATPLLLALVTVEIADAIFALDSIPAVFGVTTDRFIVFTSNLFAVLGLRSLYFAVAGLFDRLRYLKHGLVGVLAIIGSKMLLSIVWPAPAWLSLLIVALILGGAIVASLVIPATSTEKTLNAEQS